MNTNWTRCLIFARRSAGLSAPFPSGQEAVQSGRGGGLAPAEPNGRRPESGGSVAFTSWIEGKFLVPLRRAASSRGLMVDRWPINRSEPDEWRLPESVIPEGAAIPDSRTDRAQR